MKNCQCTAFKKINGVNPYFNSHVHDVLSWVSPIAFDIESFLGDKW